MTALIAEKRRRLAKAEHSTRGYRDENGVWQGGLLSFVRYFWHILEPGTEFTEGWPLEAVCLPYATQIITSEGVKNIGDIVENKWSGAVLSFNHTTNLPEWKSIVAHMKSAGAPTLTISAGGNAISLTDNHPVFVSGRGYVRADQVEVGDQIKLHSMPAGICSPPKPQSILQPKVLAGQPIRQGESEECAKLQALWERIYSLPLKAAGRLLFNALLWIGKDYPGESRVPQMRRLQILGRTWLSLLLRKIQKNRSNVRMYALRQRDVSISSAVRTGFQKVWRILQPEMLRLGIAWAKERFLCEWGWYSQVSHRILVGEAFDIKAREAFLFPVLKQKNSGHPPYRSKQVQQRNMESRSSLSGLPLCATRPIHAFSEQRGGAETGGAIIDSISRDPRIPDAVYNIEVEGNNNYFANQILVHNCEHLEAVTFGEITNLLINIFPGAMKSLLTNVFFPAWEWGPMGMAHVRYVTFSYSSSNTERDNQRFGDLLASAEYQAMYPEVAIRQNGMTMVSNYKHGWKLASSVTGSVTGKRGNRAICDDLNNVKESESQAVMEETNRWFRESLSSRLNNMEKDAKIVIAQRVGEGDVSGEILTLGLPYCHLCIAMEYVWSADDEGNPYETQIGWVDPRWRPNPEDCNGELAWPERFPEKVVQALKKELSVYATAAQLQQTPEARGGGIIKRDWWQAGEPYMVNGKYPALSYVVASLDGAYTEKEENDPSALTVWGIFQNEQGYNRAMLLHAWRKRLQFSGPKVPVLPGEHESVWRRRAMQHWGLIEWVADTCKRFQADKLLIESKATGISAAQSLRNSHGREGWGIELVEPHGDKVARAIAVQPSWSQEMVYAPDREWADLVIDEMAVFPKGRYKDLTDSSTQAIKHLRDTGLLRSDEERRAQEVEAVRHKGGPKRALYPGFAKRVA